MFKNLFSSTSREERFWQWFTEQLPHWPEGTPTEAQQEQLQDKIASVDPHLSVILEVSNQNKQFIITADGIKESFPHVERLQQLTPADTGGWQVIAFRPSKPDQPFEYTNEGIQLTDQDVFFRYSDEGEAIGLELSIKGLDPENDLYEEAIIQLLEQLLGEYMTTMCIAWLTAKPLDDAEVNDLFTIQELPGMLQNMLDNN